jgi:hypothetical protein
MTIYKKRPDEIPALAAISGDVPQIALQFRIGHVDYPIARPLSVHVKRGAVGRHIFEAQSANFSDTKTGCNHKLYDGSKHQITPSPATCV